MSTPDIEIKFDQAALQTMVEKWVMEQMTEETRKQVLSQAISYLMKVPNTSYGPRESPLQTAFNSAIESVMRQVARDLIENDETIKATLHQMMGEALQTFLQASWQDRKDPFVKAMGEAFSTAFSNSDRY